MYCMELDKARKKIKQNKIKVQNRNKKDEEDIGIVDDVGVGMSADEKKLKQ